MDAQLGETHDVGLGPGIGGDQHRLGELQFQMLGPRAGAFQDGEDVVAKIRIADLLSAEVDGDASEFQTPVAPVARLPAHGLQHPVREWPDQPAFFGHRQKGARLEYALARMTPAHQGFHADQPPRSQIELGLILQEQLVVLDRLGQLARDLHFAPQLLGHGVLEEGMGAAPGFLGLVECDIGARDEIVDVVALRVRDQDADAGVDADPVVADQEFLLQGFDDLAGQRAGLADLVDMALQQREFVAAETRQDVGAARDRGQTFGHGAQQFVADRMPQGVVDVLEVIQVQHV